MILTLRGSGAACFQIVRLSSRGSFGNRANSFSGSSSMTIGLLIDDPGLSMTLTSLSLPGLGELEETGV
jgi:hypothetical protein